MFEQTRDAQCPHGHMTILRRPDAPPDRRYYCTECGRDCDAASGPMYPEYDVETIDAGPSRTGHVPKTAGEIRRRLNVHTSMLPLSAREHDRIGASLSVRNFFENQRVTRRELSMTRIVSGIDYCDEGEDMNHAVRDRMWLTHGIQIIDAGELSQAKRIYLNPNYVHYDSVGPPVEFGEDSIVHWISMYASLGHVPPETVERNLGIDSVYDYCPDWDHQRAAGRVRMANTMKVAYEWADGYTKRDLCRAYNVHHSTFYDYVDNYSELVSVPPDPYLSIYGPDGEERGWEVERDPTLPKSPGVV